MSEEAILKIKSLLALVNLAPRAALIKTLVNLHRNAVILSPYHHHSSAKCRYAWLRAM